MTEEKTNLKSVKGQLKSITVGQTHINDSLEQAFLKMERKDKDFDNKLARFRPEKYGLANKEIVEEDMQSTRKAMHDRFRAIEL